MSVVECEEVRRWLERKSRFYLLNCMKQKVQTIERIPGACDFALDEISTLQDLIQSLARLGIRKDSYWVVCYQVTGLDAACEVWWLLRALGRDNSAVLSGGLTEWRRLRYPTTMDVPIPNPVLPFYDGGYEQMPHRYKLESEIQEMQRFPGYPLQLIDTQGTFHDSIPYDPVLGILPGGKLDSKAELRMTMERCGIDLGEGTASIVIGALASVALLQLTSVGKRNVAVGLVDRSRDDQRDFGSGLEINNEDFYSVLEANHAPSQYLSVVETIYYDALGGGSQRFSHTQNSELQIYGMHSKGVSYSSDQMKGKQGPVAVLDVDLPRPKPENRMKVGKEELCAHCRLV